MPLVDGGRAIESVSDCFRWFERSERTWVVVPRRIRFALSCGAAGASKETRRGGTRTMISM